MKKIVFLLSLVLTCHSNAQNKQATAPQPASTHPDQIVQDWKRLGKMQIMSPQTADMIRYDNVSVIENTGALNLSIPLIHFNDPDFELPVSISYNSSGFRPFEPDNFTGRNWSLNCAGMIYREIKGKADDLMYSTGDNMDNAQGFLKTCRSGKYDNESVKNAVLTNNPAHTVNTSIFEAVPTFKNDETMEFSSDIYHFTFGQYKGKFTINFDGTINVVSENGGKLKVDISRYEPKYSTASYNSEIVITTDDGYKYSFGGNYNAVEYNAVTWVNASYSVGKYANQVVGFYLTRIEAPNGRTLNISYLGDNIESQFHEYPFYLLQNGNYDHLVAKKCNLNYSLAVMPFESTHLNRSIILNFGAVVIDDPPYDTETSLLFSLNKVALIDKITTDDKEVKFTYSPPNTRPASRVSCFSKFALECGAQLDKVTLATNFGTITESCELSYTLGYDGNQYLMLQSVKNSREGEYSFTYDNHGTNDYTSKYAKNIDYWGFWRGNLDFAENGLIPSLQIAYYSNSELSNDLSYEEDHRKPTGKEFDASLLNKVTFPTGGYISIEYEPNDYSAELAQSAATQYVKKLKQYDSNYLCGGARVKSINYYTDGISKITYYKYDKSLHSNVSSGILAYKPRFHHLSRTTNGQQGNRFNYLVLGNSNGFNTPDYGQSHVYYSTVIKYDVESIRETADSTATFGLSAPDNDKTILEYVSVGTLKYYHPDGDFLEKEYGLWRILGGAYENDKTAESSITITDRKTNQVVYTKKFLPGSRETIEFNPRTRFPEGNYVVTMSKKGTADVHLIVSYPQTARKYVEGPTEITQFTDHATNPDLYSDTHSYWAYGQLNPSSVVLFQQDEIFLKHFFLDPEDYSIERGRVLSRTYCGKDGDTVKTVRYKYRRYGFDDRFSIYASAPAMTSNALTNVYNHINKVRFYHYLPIEKQTVQYDGTAKSITTESYDYNQDGYLKKQVVSLDNGREEITTYRYLGDDAGSAWKDRNILSPLTRSEVVVKNADGEVKPIRNWSCTYTDLGKPHVITEQSDTTRVSGVTYQKYDGYGNPLAILTSKNEHIVYLWGYYGKYPIAKILNATYEEVTRAIDADPGSLSTSWNGNYDKLELLRNNLPDAQVYTYTYRPLVGMISRTDPSDQTTYFKYDQAGRLLSTELELDNGSRQIVNVNEYNLLNQ